MIDFAQAKDSVEMAQENLVNYRRIMLQTGKDEAASAPFHYRWSDKLLNSTKHQAIEGFRESAKGQIVLRSFPLYCLTFPHRDRDFIAIIKANKTQARAKLREIEREFETNPVISANCVKILEKSGDVLSADIRDPNQPEGPPINIRIEGYGKGESIRGLANIDRRPKICILDDIQDIEDSRSDTVLESDWDWFLSDVTFLGQYTRIFLIGNNLGEKCVVERAIANADSLGFECEKVRCANEDYTKSTWPAKYSIEEILAQKESYRKIGKLEVWIREKMCEAVSDETRIFKKEDFRYYTASTIEKIMMDCNPWMTIDPASSRSEKSDYRALVVNGCDSDNKWFIADVSYGRYDSMTVIDELFRLVVKWNLKEVGMEDGEYKNVIQPFITKEMSKRNIFFNILPLKHGGTRKEERIKMLQPRFKAHTIWFPDDAPWLAEMEAELMSFTMEGCKGLHDDLIDALAYQEQIAQAPFNAGRRSSLSQEPAKEEALI
jgi:predicted phage terminase large subunit-like protein